MLMKKMVEKLKNKFYYSIDSIRNRYPCKLIKIKNHYDINKKTMITYQAVNRLNVRESTLENILNDAMIIEKFHPTEAVKIGFLSAGGILFKKGKSFLESRNQLKKKKFTTFSESLFI